MPITNEIKDIEQDNSKKPKKKGVLRAILPWKGDKLSEKIRKLIFIISSIVLVVSVYLLFSYFWGEKKAEKLNTDLQAIYSNADTSTDDSSTAEPQMLDKFAKLYEMNPEIVGWIEIPDTPISYPVMQTTDNEYYLKHDFNKDTSKSGSIFADYRVPINLENGLPDNTVLYGHNMKSGMFFHHLHDYKKLDFMKSHATIKFNTLYNEQEWKVFACFLTGINADQDGGVLFDYHNKLKFDTPEEFQDYYDNVMKRSYYLTDVDVKYGDELLTLSTCSTEFFDSRFVIVARKVRPGESATVNPDKIVTNPDRYMPLVWYKIQNIKPPR